MMMSSSSSTPSSINISPYIASLTASLLFLLLLLLVVHTNATARQSTFSPVITSRSEGGVLAATNIRRMAELRIPRHATENSLKRNGFKVPSTSKRRSSGHSSRVFNASAHEVPSGPNPVSNR